MKKFSEKSRKVLRKIYMLFGATAVSVLFAACYGMPMDRYCMNEDCTCEDCWGDCACGEDNSEVEE